MGKLIWKVAGTLTALTLVTTVWAAPQTGASDPKLGSVESAPAVDTPEAITSLGDQKAATGGQFAGRVMSVKRNVVLHLDEQVAVTTKHTSMLPIGPRNASVPVETIDVSGGRVDAQIPDGAAQGVLLHALGVQAISTSGRLAMIAGKNSVVVAAISGEALVGVKGRFKPLAAGQIRHFNLSSGLVSDRAFLPAPTTAFSGLSVALSGEGEVNLSTKPVPGAVRYRALLLNQDGSQVGEWIESSDPQTLSARVPQAGAYSATVLAIDEFGFASAPSERRMVQVLGMSNGKAVVRDGMIFLGPGETAQLVGQQGLMMRYGTSPEFIPAPSSISLPGRQATTVEFRDPRDPHRSAVFKLAPRLLNTRIVVGRPQSQWPRDNIDISVKMWDGHGHPLSWMDEYQMVVRVGVREVPVEWQRTNGALTAVLPPQPGPGPWIVRVSVVDPSGSEIGRNFREIVAPGTTKQ